MGDKTDNLDMRILGRLLNNCRESDRQIGRALGVSGGAVGARIRRMERRGIITDYVVKVEPPVLGYGILYFVVSGEDTAEILRQVGLVGRPYIVVPCVGGITVCGIVTRDDPRRAADLALGLMRDARVITTFAADATGFDSNLTKTDLGILGELAGDPRLGTEEVARRAGLSARTAARSIEKLQGNGGIQFTLAYDPQMIDGFIPYAVLARIDGDFEAALAGLNREFSESYLQIPFLARDQVALLMYGKTVYQMDETTQRVRAMASVRSADLFIPKRMSFHDGWLRGAIAEFRRSPTLHLYQTG